jgi:hypothetical protein
LGELNWDASYREDENRGGWGAVLRNDTGHTLRTAWGSIDKCPLAEMAEAMVGQQSIRAILPLYAGPIHMENDCSSLITELNGDASSKSAILGIVRDIRSLKENLPEYSLSNIRRSRNEVAHHLARLCRSTVTEGMMLGLAPPCVVSLIERECNVYSDV